MEFQRCGFAAAQCGKAPPYRRERSPKLLPEAQPQEEEEECWTIRQSLIALGGGKATPFTIAPWIYLARDSKVKYHARPIDWLVVVRLQGSIES